MTGTITPWFRNFWTDVFGGVVNFQSHPQCANHELRVVDCLEAYGTIHGKTKCRVLLEDFRECVLRGKQLARIRIMRNERERQINDGERPYEEAWAEAPHTDAY